MKTCAVDELRTILSNPREGVYFVDVRTLEEYQRGHIEGFMNIPVDADLSHWGKIAKNAPIYLLCLSGARSQKAGQFLAQMGYGNLMNVEGGMLAWRARGYPVVT